MNIIEAIKFMREGKCITRKGLKVYLCIPESVHKQKIEMRGYETEYKPNIEKDCALGLETLDHHDYEIATDEFIKDVNQKINCGF